MTLFKNIREFRIDKGWTQNDLAKFSGVSVETIKRYENGKTNPTNINLEKIANALGIKIKNLYEDMSPSMSLNQDIFMSPSDKFKSLSQRNLKKLQEKSDIISIPYFEDTYASAGDGAINYDEAPNVLKFTESFLRDFLRINGNLEKVHVINARGDSMEPTITNGELLFINSMNNEGSVVSGYIYIINYDGDVFVKRLEKNPVTKTITLFSDNEKYEPIIISGKNLERCHIIGRVVAHMKKA